MKIFREEQIRARFPGRNLSKEEVLDISMELIRQSLEAAKKNKLENWKYLAGYTLAFIGCAGLLVINPDVLKINI